MAPNTSINVIPSFCRLSVDAIERFHRHDLEGEQRIRLVDLGATQRHGRTRIGKRVAIGD
jgi:hypothetical protein